MTKKLKNAISTRTGRAPMQAFLAQSALLLAAFLLAGSLGAQTLNGNIGLFTQTQIDNFNYTEVTGTITMNGNPIFSGTDPIVDLSGLSELETVGGSFQIASINEVNLDDLANLTTVGGSLRIVVNPDLEDATLPSLESTGFLEFNQNQSLESFSLPSLTQVNGDLWLVSNGSLSECCIVEQWIDDMIITGTVSVQGNAQGCRSLSDIQDACTPDPCANDTEAPTISCPGTITPAVLDPNNCTNALPDYRPFVNAGDNCDTELTLTQSPAPNTIITGVQTVTVTMTATDDAGLSASCTYEVPHVDVTPPDLDCPNVEVNNDPGQCGAVVNFAPTASDNCSTPTITYSQDPGTFFPAGTTTVSATAADAAGNPASCSFTVTVNDTQNACNPDPAEALDFDGEDDRIQMEGLNLASPLTIEAWVKPNQKFDFSTIMSNKLGGGSNPGFTFAINTFQASNGKLLFETQNAEVVSQSSVTWGVWQHVAVTYDGSVAKMYINGIEVGTNPTSSVNLNPSPYPTFIGDYYLYVFDNGKYDGQMDEVRVWNRALCEAEIMARMNCELSGSEADLVAYYQFNEGAAGGDNTGLTTLPDMTANGNNGTLNNFALNGPASNWVAPGAVTTGVNCTTTPSCGVPPSIVCPADIVVPNDPGLCSAVVSFAATDAAGVPPSTITYSQNPGTAFPVGTTTVTATATNAEGSDACSFTITVNDTEAPSISCPTDIMVNNDPGDCGAIINFAATASDNCGVTSLTYSQDPGAFFPVGMTTVTASASDAAGNPTSCTFKLMVKDNEPPVAVCQTNTVYLEAVPDGPMGQYTGLYVLQDEDVLDFATSFDNCGPVTVTDLSPSVFNCDQLGTTQLVTVTVTDVNGNTAACTADITVAEAQDMPPGWTNTDIDNGNGDNYTYGNANGDATFAPCNGIGGTYTISSMGPSGQQSDNDQHHSVYKEFCGPAEFIAHLASMEVGARAGIEFRESTDEESARLALKIWRPGVNQFMIIREYRPSAGAPLQTAVFPVLASHNWLRIVRTVNPFNGFQTYSLWTSFNGQTWQPPNFFLAGVVKPQWNDCLVAAMSVSGTVPFETRSATFDGVQLLMSGGDDLDAFTPDTGAETPALRAKQLSVYPNPAGAEAFINLDDYIGEPVDVRVFNLTGQAVDYLELDRVEMGRQRLDVSNYPPGTYLIRVQTDDGQVRTTRLVVQ